MKQAKTHQEQSTTHLTCVVVLGHVSRVRKRGLQRQTWIFSVAPATAKKTESETRAVVRRLHTVPTGNGGAKLQSHENDITNKKKMSFAHVIPVIFSFLISSEG